MTRMITLIALFLGIVVAHGQPQQPPPAPLEQALGRKLMVEINDGLQCQASLISLGSVQQDLAKAQARIKELEAKLEPKDPP